MKVNLTREEFEARLAPGALIPLWTEMLWDLETMVAAYMRLHGIFFLESANDGTHHGRYSYIGIDPWYEVIACGQEVTIRKNGRETKRILHKGEDPLHVVQEVMDSIHYVSDGALGNFSGGAIGYVGYDFVRYLENIGPVLPDEIGAPDMYQVIPRTMLIFDNVNHALKIVTFVPADDPGDLYAQAVNSLSRTHQRLTENRFIKRKPVLPAEPFESRVTSATTKEDHMAMVGIAKEYVAKGDMIQCVLSRRLSVATHADPFQIYLWQRHINPSPHMFYMNIEGVQIVGASPEILATSIDGTVRTRPLAGTVRRGKDDAEDAVRATQLAADPKERAEHIMLVDLGRNDLTRVCDPVTVEVGQYIGTETYSHVIHLVSDITGTQHPDATAYDVIRAVLPAGTLSGAPKVRAMQVINELECTKRGVYGGSITFFDFHGNMKSAITIRTIVCQNGVAHVQSGGGIVADSIPQAEFDETLAKAAAMLRAIERAESEEGHEFI